MLNRAHNIALTQKSEPCVQLKVDMKPFAEASEDWEPPNINPTPTMMPPNKEQPTICPAPQQVEKQESQTGFQGLIMNQVCENSGTFIFCQIFIFSIIPKISNMIMNDLSIPF